MQQQSDTKLGGNCRQVSVSHLRQKSGDRVTYSRMHWNAQKTPGKYSAPPIVGPIQCVEGELPVQPKMLRYPVR